MSRRFAGVVTIAYLLVAGAWVTFSDIMLGSMGLSAERVASLSLIKGIGFVLVTGAVLFFSAGHAGRRVAGLSERLTTVIEVSPIPIVTLDLDGNVTLWNAAAERVFGWSAAEVLGKPTPFVPDESREEALGILERVVSGNSAAGLELMRVAKDGRTLLIRIFTAAIHDERGTVSGTMGVIEDITERRAARRELERYRDHLEELVGERTLELQRANDALQSATDAKDTFLASMSHELRTPLNSIIGFSGIMLQGLAGPLNEEQGKQLKMVNSAGHHLLDLINDVLDLVKIEAGHAAPNLESVRIADVLDSVEGIIRPLADEKRLELSSSASGDLTIVTDRRRLEQILINLLSNSVKFTSEGSISIVVIPAEDTVRFEISDTGVGIAQDALESIFDEFVQIERADRLRPDGTGLGLAISRRLAGLLGGRVFARSQAGVGSVFVLELPLEPAIQLPSEPAASDPAECSILVVDDDASARRIVSLVLGAKGYRVVEASDGERALALVAEERPDCILLDLMMPRLDGWGVLERLRDDPETADIPVICVSIIDEAEHVSTEGFVGYLVKPVEPEGLVAMLETTLASHPCSTTPESEGPA
jgi:PAS domain S-box-containing protein